MDNASQRDGLRAWEAFVFAHAAMIGRIERELSTAGAISLAWYDVLAALSRAPDHRLRMSDLADEVVLSRSGLSRLVDRIEAAGLVRREPGETDRRSAYAVLTGAGQAAVLATWPIYRQGIERYFAGQLSDDELRVLTVVFQRLRVVARDLPAEP